MQSNDQDLRYGRPIPEPYQLYGVGKGESLETAAKLPEQDLEYIQSLYPDKMKRIHGYVKETCDKLDYKNSPIYDEYPDRIIIDNICYSICQKIICENGACTGEYSGYMNQGPTETKRVTEVEEVEAYELARIQSLSSRGLSRPPQPPWGPPGPPPPPWPPGPPRPPQPPWGPPGPPPPPWPPGPPRPPQPPWGPPPPPRPPYGSNWMNDIVKILFLNEMFNRRCRSGRCY